MATPVIVYQCPVCNKGYKTAEEAEACYKSPRGRFVPGDIVWDGRTQGFVYRIKHLDPVGSPAVDGAAVEFVQEHRKAAYMVNQAKEAVWLVGGFWCRAEPYPIQDAKELMDELGARLKAATEFYQQVRATNERHIDPSTEPLFTSR